MRTPDEYFDEFSLSYTEMDEWTVTNYKLAMKFAKDYADGRELEVRKALAAERGGAK